MRRLTFAFGIGCFLVTVGGWASPEAERAVATGREAYGLYGAGRYAEAFERFVIADRMAHSPVFVFYMARCKRNTGHLLEARALFERVARESLPADATEPMLRARSDAAEELATVSERIPTIVVQVAGVDARRVELTVDGVPAKAGAVIELDPGAHRVEARTPQGSASRTLDLQEGRHRLPIVLAPRAADTPSTTARGSIVPGIVALGVGAGALGVGGVTGLVAADKASRVKEGCEGVHCLRSDEQEASSARAYATVSTVAFVVASAGVATGVVLLVVRPGGSSPGAATAVIAQPGGVRLAARF